MIQLGAAMPRNHSSIMMERDVSSSLLSGLSATALEDIFHYSPTPDASICPSDDVIEKCLRDVFRLQAFRPLQLNTIRTIMQGKDCFIRMATGSGKSLLWQLPAACQEKDSVLLTVVICPTTSLIMDQMRQLCRMTSSSFLALCYYGHLPKRLQEFTLWVLDRPHCQSLNCLLLTPDQLSHDPIKSRLMAHYKSGYLSRFIIDEADKFLTWGQTFYTEYLTLQTLRSIFPTIPIVAMTGSITMDDMDVCIKKLGMKNVAKFLYSLDRPNLYYEVKQKNNNSQALINNVVLLTSKGPGIIYCTYPHETGDIAASLRNRGITAEAYSGPLDESKKREVLDKWKGNELAVVVATTAFGMGIDKPNVRWVVHDTMPCSIETWFQESGRAGRDGKPASCVIYFQAKDYYKVKKLVGKTSKDNLFSCLKPLHSLMAVLLDKTSCRRQQLLAHFKEEYTKENCNACDYCRYSRAIQGSKQNVTVDVQNALNLLQQMRALLSQCHWTEWQLARAMFGMQGKKFKVHGVTALKGFGCGFSLENGQYATTSQILEFILLLIQKGIIIEYSRTCSNGAKNYYIKPRVHPEDFASMELHMTLPNPDVSVDKVGLEADHMVLQADASMGLKVVREFDDKSQRMVNVFLVDA